MRINSSIHERVIEMAVQIQQVAAPTFHEQQRSEFILRTFQEQGAQHAWKDQTGNVYVRVAGRTKAPMIVVSAHLDTVFPAGVDLAIRRSGDKIFGPGIGDNSLGLASLFGLYWIFNQETPSSHTLPQPAGDILLVANVGEEGLGDLLGMKAVVDHLGSEPTAYIILEGMLIGNIYHRGLGVKRYRLSVKTPGGHSWLDYGRPSAIHELARLITQITDLDIPSEPRSSVNIGVISGGTSVNTIASEASCELDLRSENIDGLNFLIQAVEKIVGEANLNRGSMVKVSAEVIGDRPTGEIPGNHPLVTLAQGCYTRNRIVPRLNIGSTDANIPLSRGLPAICIGITTGGGAHTKDEYIHVSPVGHGLGIIAELIQAIFHANLNQQS